MNKMIAVAVAAALLVQGCATWQKVRPQVAALVNIAGQAAEVGAAGWLDTHPGQALAFALVVQALSAALNSGETSKVVPLLESLPVSNFAGPIGDVYVSGAPKRQADKAGRLVVWDGERAVTVAGDDFEPVARAVAAGLRRGIVTRLAGDEAGKTNAAAPPAVPPAPVAKGR